MSDLPPGVRVIPPEAMPPGVRVIPPSEAAGTEAPVEQPGMVQSLWQGLLTGVEKITRGNLLGLPGPSALERNSQMMAERPYRPGMTAGEMIGPNWQENPLLYAFAPGSMNAAGGAMGGIRPPPRSFTPDIPQQPAVGPATRPAPPPEPMAFGDEAAAADFARRTPGFDKTAPGGAPTPYWYESQAPRTHTVVSETQPSIITNALASNSPAVIDREMTRSYMRAVRPGGARENAPSLTNEEQRVMTVFDQIIANRPNLKLTDPKTGEIVTGQLPRTMRQFSEALDSSKRDVFRQYDAQARAAGEAGIVVDMAPAAQRLRELATNPEVMTLHPGLSQEAEAMAARLERRPWTPSATQDLIENINQTVKGTAQNQTHETFSRNSLMSNTGAVIRDQLDKAVLESGQPGYQELRNRYGALRSVEKEVATAAKREAVKNGTLPHNLADLWSAEQIIGGLVHLPFTGTGGGMIARGAAIQAVRRVMDYVNGPNRAIERLFDRRQMLLNPIAGPNYRTGLAASPLQAGGQMGFGGTGIAEREKKRPREPRQPAGY